MPLLWRLLLLAAVLSATACNTLLLHEDFSDYPVLLSDGALIGPIPGDPEGDRISFLDPTIRMTEDGVLPGRVLSIQNRIDFELADPPEEFDRYLISWSGYQRNRSAANTRIDLLNEEEERVLRLHFTPNQLEIISDYPTVPPVFAYNSQTENTHVVAITIHVQGSNGGTSYADIEIREADGDKAEWKRMPLLGNSFERLRAIRYRADAGGAYEMDRLAVNGWQ